MQLDVLIISGLLLCRLGIWLFCIPSFRGGYWAATISPIYVFAQIMGLSGVPLQEKQQKERWGDDPAFQEYRRNTWLLLPLPQYVFAPLA